MAFTKQPGNLPDVITIENALKNLSAIGMNHAEIVTDNGYYSERNLVELFSAHFDFITLVKTNLKWVRIEIDSHLYEFNSVSSACPFDTHTHGVTVTLMHTFERTRKYASKKNGMQKGDIETFQKRIYLHIYFNPSRKAEEDAAFEASLIEISNMLESGTDISELSKSARQKATEYLTIKKRSNRIHVAFNENACKAQKDYHGFFTLVSNCEKDPFECLHKYRKRETIESFFESMKQRADGTRSRVWDTDTLRGRMFVQFVTLCYYEYFANEIRKMKPQLGVESGNPFHDSKANLKQETKLKTWLNNTPIYLILQWFDTVERTKVSSKLVSKRWTTEITARDRMFLEKLGVVLS